jgi:ABC-type branched-subunit amino acid transport system ATPase component
MDAQGEPLIEFKGVSKRFGNRNILNRIDFSIYEGEVSTRIGLSGTGKSVTLKHIIGMLKPDEGQILYRGKPIDKMSTMEWNDYIGRISYMFQNKTNTEGGYYEKTIHLTTCCQKRMVSGVSVQPSHWPRASSLNKKETCLTPIGFFGLIGVGKSFRSPRPPNRACGSPAHGSPVGGFNIVIGTPKHGLQSW